MEKKDHFDGENGQLWRRKRSTFIFQKKMFFLVRPIIVAFFFCQSRIVQEHSNICPNFSWTNTLIILFVSRCMWKPIKVKIFVHKRRIILIIQKLRFKKIFSYYFHTWMVQNDCWMKCNYEVHSSGVIWKHSHVTKLKSQGEVEMRAAFICVVFVIVMEL